MHVDKEYNDGAVLNFKVKQNAKLELTKSSASHFTYNESDCELEVVAQKIAHV